MKILKLLLFLQLFCANASLAQDIYDNYYALKNTNQYEKIKQLLKNNQNHLMYEAIKWHSEYFEKGSYDNAKFLEIDIKKINKIDLIFYYYLYGYHIKMFLPEEIETSTEFFFKGLELAKQENHTTLINEGLYLIIADLLHNENSHKLAPQYIKTYEEKAYTDYHKFWSGYMKFMYSFSRNALEKKDNTFKATDFDYLKAYTKTNSYSLSSYYNLLGIHYNQIKNNELSDKYFKLAADYNTLDYYFAKVSNFIEQNNIASNLIEQGKNREGIALLKSANKQYMMALPFVINYYKNLQMAYENLKMPDSALYYIKLIDSLKTQKVTLESNFHHQFVSTKYQLKQKEEEISFLTQKFQNNKVLYLSLIFGVFLLALYSYVRWKKEDQRKKNILAEIQNLEVQHAQVIEELQKTKQLVIEDHIVLKNKAKIYLEELIYIKAEDHYLQLITTAKKEFVRGKLSEIISELPPNFVKCHRSFIINKNFIKQILKTEIIMKNNESVPISRSFKMG